MTFSELSRIVARDGRLPAGGRPGAFAIALSAEGRPNRDASRGARAPKPITPEQAAWLRETRAA